MTDEDLILQRRPDTPTRSEIDLCGSEAQLGRWFRQAHERIGELEAYVEGYRFTGTVDADWLRRAGGQLGHQRLTARWIEARMLRLRMVPPYPPRDPRKRTIAALQGTLERYKKAMRQAGVAVPTEVQPG
jgi:hypothetical protein